MLAEFQNAFVRLAVDAAFRQAFFADSEEVLASYSLERREVRALRGIPASSLERYAASLLAKRSSEFARELPLSLRVAPSLQERYRSWLAENPAPSFSADLSPGLTEALRAFADLRHALEDDPVEAPYAGVVLAFEALHKAARADGEERTLVAPWRVDEILRDLMVGVLPTDPRPAVTYYRFTRQGVAWKASKPARESE